MNFLRRHSTRLIYCLVLLGILMFGSKYTGFLSLATLANLLGDNSHLGIIAFGLTLVIITGGIDLSVGAMIGLSCLTTAELIQKGMPPLAAAACSLLIGLTIGLIHGYLIAYQRLAPFLVTLAGLFFCRGAALAINKESVTIDNPLVFTLASSGPNIAGAKFSIPALVLVFCMLLLAVVLRQTRFGRTLYAIGGNEQSANLMGLSVNKTLLGAYGLSGLFGAFGGVVFAIYTASGSASNGVGMELDAIAATVIGGCALSGGKGSVFGTFLGVLLLGLIQTMITFDGTLSSWWMKIAIGILLLFFVLIQRFATTDRAESATSPAR